MQKIKIGSKWIGDSCEPYIIAEIGVNHNGSLDQAYKLIDAAVKTGVDAVKFQNFKAKELAQRNTPKVPYQRQDIPDEVESHYQMLLKLEMSEEMTKSIFEYCKSKNIQFLSTAYNPSDLELLLNLEVPALKFASADLVDFRLHEMAANSGLPVIQSVGIAEESEINQVLEIYRKVNSDYPIILLQCTCNYPANPINSNINYIKKLNKLTCNPVGFSDHTPNEYSAMLATAVGASVFEKHFTLDRKMDGPDHKASCEPDEMAHYVKKIKESYKILGDGIKKVVEEEKDMQKISRKGAYLKFDKLEGDEVNLEDLTIIRPALGEDIMSLRGLIGSKLTQDVKKGEQLLKSYFIK